MPVIADDIHRLNDIRVLERTAHAEFRSDLLLILPFAFALPFRSKFLHGIDSTPVLVGRLD